MRERCSLGDGGVRRLAGQGVQRSPVGVRDADGRRTSAVVDGAMPDINWATFDCFGTLIDWRHGVATSAELLFPGRGAELLERYNSHEPAVELERPTARYRDVLAETLRRATAELGLDLHPDDATILGATIPYWPVFADVAPELGALRAAGWRLALLTNCDRDIIGATQRRLGVTIDAVVTAEAVGSYKPALGHFTRFAEFVRA